MRKWICLQIGAREHYSIERALWRCKLLDAMVTDIWTPPSTSMSYIPGETGRQVRSRFHAELSEANVIAFSRSSLSFEVTSRVKRQSAWSTIMNRNRWFQGKGSRVLAKLVSSKPVSEPTSTPVVFSYSYAAKELFLAAKKLGCKTVLGQIDPGPQEFKLVNQIEAAHGAPLTPAPPEKYWQMWREECDLADIIVVNSNWSKRLMLESGIATEKIRVVPLVYERRASLIENQKLAEDTEFDSLRPLKVLYLGQVIARKGVIEMTEAIRKMKGCPVHWTIVGGGDARLLAVLRQLSNVTVTGQVNRDLVEQYYRSHDVFLLPTHSDGFALTQLEAAAYGLPIIASKSCGDVVQHMGDGLLLPEVSAGAIVEAVKTLLREPEMLSSLSEAMRARKFRDLDWLSNKLSNIAAEFDE